MCARYTLTRDEAVIVVKMLRLVLGFVPRFNVAPTQRMPVIVENSQGVKQTEMR